MDLFIYCRKRNMFENSLPDPGTVARAENAFDAV